MGSISPMSQAGYGDVPGGFGRTGRRWLSLRPHFWVLLFCIVAVSGWVWAGVVWIGKPAQQTPVPSVQEAAVPQEAKSTVISVPEAATPDTSFQVANVPVPKPSQIVQSQISPGEVAYLGVRGTKFRHGTVIGLKILEVFPDSPAAMAGLRSERDPFRTTGEIITKANDRPLRSEEDLRLLLQSSNPGDQIVLSVTSSKGDYYQLVPVVLGGTPARTNSAVGKQSLVTPGAQETSMSSLEEEILNEVNRVRIENGLGPLLANPRLQKVAQQYSRQMATQNFFSHVSPDGQDIVDRLQAERIEGFRSAGENIFACVNVSDIVRASMEGWMASPGHRKNILAANYQETGIGIAVGAKNKVYVTQDFLER